MLLNTIKRYYEGKETFRIGVNQFSDMFAFERQQQNGIKFDAETTGKNGVTFIPPHKDVQIPYSIDWRKSGAVTEVKNQGQCGSCWAFSATGSLEGQHFRKSGKLVSLSEQNLVDCVVKGTLREDCDGGLMTDAFDYINKNGGIDTEESYPYKAENGKCHFSNKTIGATDKGFVKIETFNEDALLKAVATVGPIAVAVEVTDKFEDYQDGIFYDPDCSSHNPHKLNHGVLVVGYGTNEGGEDYWLVKNSWGADWGMNGYLMMSRGQSNNCGIATMASYPLV
ncbi:Cathepsin L1 [Armadillidium nasatum]|uniref:Cathepsin L1 n=1 Tax=Armadillidium nasatum TaxID=96803 RepID=A0A5N5TCU3_9CRUS|nr:Cathepsin L1 [Armadillidium nasatum]